MKHLIDARGLANVVTRRDMFRSRSLTQRAKLVREVSILFFVATLAPFAFADPISFTLSSATLSAEPDQTVIFEGTVTNTSGVSLNASDLFFNFSNYDPISISDITQLLGNPDFNIPDNTFSPVVDLFSVTLASTVEPGIQIVDVSLEDVNNNLSSTLTINVAIPSAATPEPSTLLLLIVASTTIFFADAVRKLPHSKRTPGKEKES